MNHTELVVYFLYIALFASAIAVGYLLLLNRKLKETVAEQRLKIIAFEKNLFSEIEPLDEDLQELFNRPGWLEKLARSHPALLVRQLATTIVIERKKTETKPL